jgi:ankyrin repeat protein
MDNFLITSTVSSYIFPTNINPSFHPSMNRQTHRLFHKKLYQQMSRSQRGRFVAEFMNAAGMYGNLDTVKDCVQRGVNVEAEKGDCWRAMHYACCYGHLEIVQYLVEEGRANIRVREKEGWTPLHLASQFGHFDIVKYITQDRKVHPHTQVSNDGTIALHVASQSGHIQIVQYLVEECGVDTTITTKEGSTASIVASEHGKQNVVEYLSKLPKKV